MTAKAYVQDSWETDGVKVAIKPHRDQVMVWGVTAVRRVEEQDTLAPDENVWLHLPSDTGRALYEALDRYYGGVHHEGDNRADLMHERKRVDHFIEVVTKKEMRRGL